MTIEFYNFTKRSNSTALPSSGATSLSCQLKENTNMVNPTLVILNVPAAWNPIWNYVRIPGFDRYYFINNWRWLNGVWECDCICDVLASFKTQIGGLTEYVLRSSFAYNGQVVDLQYVTTAETRVNSTMLDNRFQSVYAGGYYVLGVISNDNSSAMGAVTYYQMTPGQLAALKQYMMSDTFLADQGLNVQTITDVLPNELLKTLYDPFKYIASCIWMPFPMAQIPSSLKTLESIAFGWWTPTDGGTNIQGYRINPTGYVATIYANNSNGRLPIYGHPQRLDRGVFLDHAPFADRMLYYPPFGSIPINDDSIIGGDFIRVEITVDMVMGDAILTVYHDRPAGNDNYTNMGVIGRVAAPLGVPIQLAQSTIDINGSVTAAETMAVQGTVSTFVSKAASGPATLGGAVSAIFKTAKSAVTSTVSAIGDVLSNPVGQLQTSGSNGSVAQYSTHPYFVQKWRIVANDDNTQKGRPLCEVRVLNTIPGFIMVDSPDVPIACMESERQQIIAFLSGGFYYE